MMTGLPLFVLLSGVVSAGCFPVTGNRILGRDLALADPQLSALPSTLAVGFAPNPGAKRVYAVAELQKLARANEILLKDPADICFEVPMTQVKEEDVTAAMRRVLPAGASLKIIEQAKVDVPVGEIEFPLDGLEPPTPANPGTQLWRGHVKYAETRRAAYWARVALSAQVIAVVADRDLPANTTINPASLRVETYTGPLERERIAVRTEDVSGRVLKRAVKAGAPIPLGLLLDPPAVRRGDLVQVEVESGPAHLQFQAVAESAGSEGSVIELRNPLSGKTFRARLNRGSKAIVVVPAGQRL